MNEALGNCLAVTVTPGERLLNRNKESQTAASWSNDLPFLGLASTSITWIKFESRAMFLLDAGSYLEYRKYLAIYCCHKLLVVCCGKQRMAPSRNLSIWSKGFHPFLAPVCTLVIFYNSRKNKFKQKFFKGSIMLLTKCRYVCLICSFDAFESRCWRRLLDCKEIKPVSPKGNQPWIFIGRLMLKLKLQYFGHLMQRSDSLEKTLMLGKIEGKRRRGRWRIRWLDSITDSMNVNLFCMFILYVYYGR